MFAPEQLMLLNYDTPILNNVRLPKTRHYYRGDSVAWDSFNKKSYRLM